ncbi:glycosyltransferase family 1 protein [Bacteroides stercoris]|uniref:Glycosyltransferase family 1 protein n=2 Tax=Bacteroides stercoris TaxID=46506 RepID=A0A413E3H3_BACSE|nr:glycosyltransferase family 1 protein [Bacteroides stercoris]RGW98088.1 glycosyltransferase family 1 protein [Bacteroides stercoris]
MKMSKVLIIATSRKTRGGITSVIKAHKTGEQWKKFHCKWIETHRDGNNIRKLWYLGTALIEYFCLLPFYDIVHIHIATTQSAKRKQLFFYPAKWMKKKIILHFHPSNEKFLFEPYNQALYRKLFSQADLVLVLSEQWKRWIKEALGLTEHIEILYNPCPIVNRRDDIREKSILFAGTIIPRKGYETLLRGFALIASIYPEWRITFAGNGEIENAQRIAKELKIEKQVEFLGWVSGNKKEQAFQKASIYCLASDGEGFPMGVLDAWAYGIPSVVTPVGGIPDIVTNGENGLVFKVNNETELAKQLEKIITNNNLYKKLADASIHLARTTFNISTINRQLERIYSNLLK